MSQTKAELIEPQGNVAFDTNTLYVDAGNNRVGIGTTSPRSTLTVAGQYSIDNNTTDPNDGSAYLFQQGGVGWNLASTNIAFSTGGSGSRSERARIDSSGRLLVGTSSARSNFYNSTGSAILQVEGTTSDVAVSITSNSATATSQLVLNRSKGTTVGSNTVVAADDFLGGIQFQGSDGTEFVQAAIIAAQVDGTPGANDMPGRLAFFTTADGASSPTERMRIDNAGRVSIATTANNGFNLSVSGASSAQFGDAADQSYGAVQIARPADQPDNKFHLCFIRSQQKAAGMGFLDNSSTFAIQNTDNNTGNGVTLTNGATSWGTTSDERKKRITANIETGLDKISDWRCVYFSYLNEPEEVVRVGLIAQDVQQTLPEAVSVEEDEIGTLQLKYTELIPVLVKALQESKQRIETLEARVAALMSA